MVDHDYIDQHGRNSVERERHYRETLVNNFVLAMSGFGFEGEFTVGCHEDAFTLSFGIECNHRFFMDLSAKDFADIARIFRRAERRSRPARRAASPVSIRPGGEASS